MTGIPAGRSLGRDMGSLRDLGVRESAVRTALALVPGVAFVAAYIAADPRQPLRTGLIAIAAAIVFVAVRDRRPATPTARLALATVALLLSLLVGSGVVNGLASAVWGVHGRFEGLVSWGVLVSVGLAGWVVGGDRARWLSRAAAVGAVAQSLVVALQLARGLAPLGTLGNQVLTGGWLAICVSFAVAGSFAERGRRRVPLAVAAVLGGLALGAVGSRGAWVGLAIGLAPVAWAL
ncbi:MAG: hypothetical protein ACYC52_11260, partial [Coriobacteriia bacterium]